MTEKEKKMLVGMAFIEAKKKLNPEELSITKLATKIAEQKKVSLGERTIRNIFNYHYNNAGKSVSVLSSENAKSLINYIYDKDFTKNLEAEKHFKAFPLSQETIDKELSFLITKDLQANEAKEIKEEEYSSENNTLSNIINNNISIKKDNNFNVFVVYALAVIVILSIVFGFLHFGNKNQTIQVNNIQQISPTKDTRFFSRETGNPEVWYTNYNDKIEFYNGEGYHPKTNEKLIPVNKDFIRTYFLEKLPIEEDNRNPLPINEQNSNKNDDEKISIFNQFVQNTDKKDISVFVFDSIHKLENSFYNHLKKELTSKNYNVTPTLILPSKLNNTIVEHLLINDFSYFNENLLKYTDYICIGKVQYQFKKNTINEKMITCQLQIDYSIISLSPKKIEKSYSKMIFGNGFSKTSAKNNTIKKFKL